MFDPFSNDGKYFTIYGYLDERETFHQVRVIPITRSPERIEDPSDGEALIDAVVTSEEYDGTTLISTRRWQHSLERFDDGTYGHIFSANFGVVGGRTYRLFVTRKDGIVTSAETTVPIVSARDVLTREPFVVNADSTEIYQVVTSAAPLNRPWGVWVRYIIEGGDVNRGLVSVRYDGEPGPDDQWMVVIRPLEDREEIDAVIEYELSVGRLEPEQAIGLVAMGVSYRFPDANWTIPSIDVIGDGVQQPGAYSNVENGYGVWGSLGSYTEEWNAFGYSGLIGLDTVFSANTSFR